MSGNNIYTSKFHSSKYFQDDDILSIVVKLLKSSIYDLYVSQDKGNSLNSLLTTSNLFNYISFSKQPERADISSNVAFILAKHLHSNPKNIAAQIAEHINHMKETESKSARSNLTYSIVKMFSKITTAGPYINIFLNFNYVINKLNELNKLNKRNININDILGKNYSRKGFDFIFEFPSVNPNKPWHLGHLRNALIGDTLANLMEARGYSVLRMDYIDNLGLQIAQTLWWILKNKYNLKGSDNSKQKSNQKYDNWLGSLYVEAARQLEDPNNLKQANDILKQLENPNTKIAEQGRTMTELCVHAQYETAYKFGIYHHLLFFESEVVSELLNSGIKMLKSNKHIYLSKHGKNKGCVVTKISDKLKDKFGSTKSDEKVLIRSNGTLTYTGKDIIFHLWKSGLLKKDIYITKFDTIKYDNQKHITYMTSFKTKKNKEDTKTFKFSLSINNAKKSRNKILEKKTTYPYLINIIGSEQALPQAVVSDIIDRLSNGKVNLIHISYEHVKLPEGNFSGRKGTWKGYSADEFVSQLMNLIKQTFYRDKTMDENAFKIAVGAVRYSFLKISPSKSIVFDWKSALSTKGNTGPYLQYALVRAKSILNKLNETENNDKNKDRTELPINYSPSEIERKLILLLLNTSHIIKRPDSNPSNINTYYDIVSICDHTYNLAVEFNKFYTSHRVYNAESNEAKSFRIILLKSFINTMIYLFNILGIPELEVM